MSAESTARRHSGQGGAEEAGHAARTRSPMKDPRPSTTARPPLRFGALVLAVALVPPFVWWTLVLEEVYFSGWPTSVSIFYHCLCGLLALQALNSLLYRLRPSLALSRAELLACYTCVSAGVAVAGHDHQMVYLRGWTYALWRAAHDPTWAPLADLPWPRYITIFDLKALDRVYNGFSTLYIPENYRVWIVPIAFFTVFLALIQLLGACLNRLLVIPWTENERLTFPIAQLPLEMTTTQPGFWTRRQLWIGFAIAALLSNINGLHELFPAVPQLPVKGFPVPREGIPPQYGPCLPHFIRTFPWMIGLCFLLPKELSLSVWVFFWILRFELIWCAWMGYPIPFPYQTGAVAPHIVDQGVGAYLVLFVMLCHAARQHFRHAWQCVLGRAGTAEERSGYRWSAIGAALSLLALYAGLRYVGLKAQWAALSLVTYTIMVTVICKVRGEIGPPMYDLHFGGPDRFLALYASPRNLSRSDWIGVGFLFGFNRGQRNLSLPHQTEGYWLQHQTGGNLNRLMGALVVTGAVASLVTIWGLVHLGYELGWNNMAQWRLQPQGFERIVPWLDRPTPPHYGAMGALAVGAVIALVLSVLRQRFIGFPLHPGGFVLATNWAVELMWFPMLVAWLAKTLVLRTGGVKAYRAALPFFLGLVLGDFVTGTLWAVIGYVMKLKLYDVTW